MKLQVFVHPVFPVVSDGHFLFEFLIQIIRTILPCAALGYSLLTIALLITQAFYLNFIVTKHKLFVQNGFLPAFCFLLLSSFYPSLNSFSEQLLINFLVLAGIDKILGFNHTAHPRTEIFNAGFLMSLTVLFQLSGIGFLLLFFASLALLRPTHLAEWVVGIIGFFTPIYFLVCLLFLFDKLEVLHQFPLLGFNSLLQGDFKGLHLILLSGLFLLIVLGLFSLQQNLPRVTIYVRRSWLIVVSYCFLALVIIFISAPSQNQGWILLCPPLSLIISQSFCLEKTKRFSSFTFYFTIILFIFSQLI